MVVFLCFAGAAAVASVVFFLVWGRRPDTEAVGLLGSAVGGVLTVVLLMFSVMFRQAEESMLTVLSEDERASAIPCTAQVRSAERTDAKYNKRYLWVLRLRIVPRGGTPYEIERNAQPAAALGRRLARGDVTLPCLVSATDRTRIEIPALSN